jgi:hypothetical protein
MPFFKTTENIFKNYGEHFDPNWMDSDKVILPPKTNWDYSRPMQIEDVDLWEVIYEAGFCIYAAWSPFAEFYMVMPLFADNNSSAIELYYGPGANEKVKKRMKELNLFIPNIKVWVEPEDMWLYTDS